MWASLVEKAAAQNIDFGFGIIVMGLIWLLAGVGVFIVGMNFLSDALEKSAGGGMKQMLGKISNNRFAGVGIGAGDQRQKRENASQSQHQCKKFLHVIRTSVKVSRRSESIDSISIAYFCAKSKREREKRGICMRRKGDFVR